MRSNVFITVLLVATFAGFAQANPFRDRPIEDPTEKKGVLTEKEMQAAADEMKLIMELVKEGHHLSDLGDNEGHMKMHLEIDRMLTERRARGDRLMAERGANNLFGVATRMLDHTTAKKLDLPPGSALRIFHVIKASDAEKAGLLTGDILAKVNNQILVNAGQLATLIRMLEAGDNITLHVIRDGKSIELKSKVGELKMPKFQEMSPLIIEPFKDIDFDAHRNKQDFIESVKKVKRQRQKMLDQLKHQFDQDLQNVEPNN